MTQGACSSWILVATLAAVVSFGSIASAADRVVGTITRTYVIVEDTDLVGDVTCDVGPNPCFSFGASDVELRLNGFAITGPADAATGCSGASLPGEDGINTNGRSNVSVRGPGLVRQFRRHGVLVFGSTKARILNLTVSTNCAAGIIVGATSSGALIEGNTAVRNGSSVFT